MRLETRMLLDLARRIERCEEHFVSSYYIDNIELYKKLEVLSGVAPDDGIVFDEKPGVRDERVVFLCFAATLAESGDLDALYAGRT